MEDDENRIPFIKDVELINGKTVYKYIQHSELKLKNVLDLKVRAGLEVMVQV